MQHILLILLLSLGITGCTTTKPTRAMTQSQYEQGQRFFEEGYYKRAMHELLPLACLHDKKAEYAVGYMYYYGLGVAQDTDVGYFWIKQSAEQQYEPALSASRLIKSGNGSERINHPSSII